MRKPLITFGTRGLRRVRWMLAITAVILIAMGAFLLAATGLPNDDARVGGGLVMQLVGAGSALFAWRGRWRVAETDEEIARDARLTARLDLALSGVELLFLLAALIGVLQPERFDGWWTENRGEVGFVCALIAFDTLRRTVVAWKERRTQRAQIDGA